MNITITLTDAQVAAIKQLGFTEDKQITFAQGVVSSQIKSRFKSYMENAKEAVGVLYDDAVAAGFAPPMSKGELISSKLAQLQKVLDELPGRKSDDECETSKEVAK